MKTIDLLTNQPPSARHGFTLIELLVVITIIGVLAEFTLVVVGGVEKTKYISTARAEMGAIQTALESYKAAYGFYPPSNPTPLPDNQLFNPLYFELEGVTNSNTSYGTLDGSQMVSSNTLFNLCGVSGVVNCTHGGGEDIVRAKNFLTDLRANQVGGLKTGAGPMVVLVTTVGGAGYELPAAGGAHFKSVAVQFRQSHQQSRHLRFVCAVEDRRQDQPGLQLEQAGGRQQPPALTHVRSPPKPCPSRPMPAGGVA